jgi:uncharacterized OsmC-like protein
MQAPTRTAQASTNGFDLPTLGGLVDLLHQHPEGGRATFTSRTRWENGTPGVSTRLAEYAIDGITHHEDDREHFLRTDEYVELGSTDTAPGPAEMMMAAMGSCIATTARAYAAVKGLDLAHIDVAVDGDLNMRGMFGLDATARPGLTELRVSITVEGGGDADALREVALLGYQFSPVTDCVQNGVPVKPQVNVIR